MRVIIYPSDMSDAHWSLLKPLLPSSAATGRPRSCDMRQIVNAILYVLCEGCRWRSLPKEYPPWQTVYWWFARWRDDQTLEFIRGFLVGIVRQSMERSACPSAAVMDTQSVKTASYAHTDSGYDAAKKVKGRKRAIVTDTQGLLLAVVVCSAAASENECGFRVLQRFRQTYSDTRLVWCDAGFKHTLILTAVLLWHIILCVVPRPKSTKFIPLARRWVVERTFAWLSAARRLVKDYERLPTSHEAFVELAMIRILIRRLA